MIQLIRTLTLKKLFISVYLKMNVLDVLLVLFKRFPLNFFGHPCLLEFGQRPSDIEKTCENYGGFLPTYQEMIGTELGRLCLNLFLLYFSQFGETWLVI